MTGREATSESNQCCADPARVKLLDASSTILWHEQVVANVAHSGAASPLDLPSGMAA
jgi:hypothetical protein